MNEYVRCEGLHVDVMTDSGAFVCRLEFDAYRSDLEELSLGPRDAAGIVRIEMAQADYHIHRDKYERLRSDVTIKLKFLEENKVQFTTEVFPFEICACERVPSFFFS